jgi:hypothetical protein
MNEQVVEDALRATLLSAAPFEVPTRLLERARAIPSTVSTSRRWWPNPWSARFRAVAGIALVIAVVIASAMVVAPRITPAVGGRGTPNPVTIESPFGSMAASDLELVVGDRTFRIPASSAKANVQTLTFRGSSTSGELALAWRDSGDPMTLVVFFAANARNWWVSQIVATDGRPEAAGWVYFAGPILERPVGSAFVGDVVVASVGSTHGERASLTFGNLTLRAFSAETPRDPKSGPMPSVLGQALPDFVPMVSGDRVVGYVSTAWQGQTPITTFRGQVPDQPVFGPDLETIVGYSVAGQGFVPLGSWHSTPLADVSPTPTPTMSALSAATQQVTCEPNAIDCVAETRAVLAAVANFGHQITGISFRDDAMCIWYPFLEGLHSCPAIVEPDGTQRMTSAVVTFAAMDPQAFINLAWLPDGSIESTIAFVAPPPGATPFQAMPSPQAPR